MSTRHIAATDLESPSGHPIARSPDGTTFWQVAGHHGAFLCGPYASVHNGVYRVKGIACVEAGGEAQSTFEVFDVRVDNRTYATLRFSANPEVFIRVYESEGLEFRFRTSGEALTVYGGEIEPILLDKDVADAAQIRSVIDRVVAGGGELDAVFRLIDRLADVGETFEAEKRRASYIQSVSPPIGHQAVWRRLALLNGGAGSPAAAAEVVAGDLTAPIWAIPIHEFDLLRPEPDLDTVLEGLGYGRRFFSATRLHRDYDEPFRTWHDRPSKTGHAGSFPTRQPLFEPFIDIDRSYQTSMARGRGFPAYCPVSGELLRSRHGFVLHYGFKPFLFYRFEGAETFYVCTGHNSDARLFVYLPRTQVIIWIGDPWHKMYNLAELVRFFLVLLAGHPREVASYLEKPTRPAAIMGNDNYGHYLNVDISGLQFMVENGLYRDVAAFIKTRTQFLVPEEIFPELTTIPLHEYDGPETVFRECLINHYLPIHFTDVSMNDALVSRLHAVATKRASPRGHPPGDAPRPLLWINLRAHNKMWSDQVSGTAAILNCLYDDFGSISAVLDGMPDCADIAAGIRRETRDEIPLYDGLNFSFYDKLNWGRASDAYLCVIGTGLIIIHSIAGIKGVAHGNLEHMTQLRFWHTIHPGTDTPIAPRNEQIEDQPGSVGLQRNYSVDWKVLLDLLRNLLRAKEMSADTVTNSIDR